MKSTNLIKHVTTLISICFWLSIAGLVFTIGSYFYSFSGNFIGTSLKVENNYSLTHDEVDKLIEMGMPLTDSRGYFIKDGKKTVINFKDNKSKYFINNSFLVSPKSWQGFLMISIAVINMLVLTYGIFLLRKFLINTKNRTPFLRENTLYIRRLAYLILFVAIVNWFFEGTLTDIIKHSYDSSHSISFSFGLSSTFIFGLLVLILATIFEYGVELKEEAELTI